MEKQHNSQPLKDEMWRMTGLNNQMQGKYFSHHQILRRKHVYLNLTAFRKSHTNSEKDLALIFIQYVWKNTFANKKLFENRV